MIPPNPETRVPCQHSRRSAVNEAALISMIADDVIEHAGEMPNSENMRAALARAICGIAAMREKPNGTLEELNERSWQIQIEAMDLFGNDNPIESAIRYAGKILSKDVPPVASLDAQSDLLDSRGQAERFSDEFEGGMR